MRLTALILTALMLLAAPAFAADEGMGGDEFGAPFAHAATALEDTDDAGMLAAAEALSDIAPAAGEAANDNILPTGDEPAGYVPLADEITDDKLIGP